MYTHQLNTQHTNKHNLRQNWEKLPRMQSPGGWCCPRQVEVLKVQGKVCRRLTLAKRRWPHGSCCIHTMHRAKDRVELNKAVLNYEHIVLLRLRWCLGPDSDDTWHVLAFSVKAQDNARILKIQSQETVDILALLKTWAYWGNTIIWVLISLFSYYVHEQNYGNL